MSYYTFNKAYGFNPVKFAMVWRGNFETKPALLFKKTEELIDVLCNERYAAGEYLVLMQRTPVNLFMQTKFNEVNWSDSGITFYNKGGCYLVDDMTIEYKHISRAFVDESGMIVIQLADRTFIKIALVINNEIQYISV